MMSEFRSRPKLELISVVTRKIPTHVRALMQSIEVLRKAGLGETPAKIVGPAAARSFLARDPRAEFISFEQLPDWYRDFTEANWNVFVKDHLFRHTDAEHVMTIHDDGFALHAEHWDERYLDFDYIGAPWPDWAHTPTRVGNGGFSIRSRLAGVAEPRSRAHFTPASEDLFCCVENIGHFTGHGCRVAPLELCGSFRWSTRYRSSPAGSSRSRSASTCGPGPIGCGGESTSEVYWRRRQEVGRWCAMPAELAKSA